jgi:hypothetical protein
MRLEQKRRLTQFKARDSSNKCNEKSWTKQEDFDQGLTVTKINCNKLQQKRKFLSFFLHIKVNFDPTIFFRNNKQNFYIALSNPTSKSNNNESNQNSNNIHLSIKIKSLYARWAMYEKKSLCQNLLTCTFDENKQILSNTTFIIDSPLVFTTVSEKGENNSSSHSC